MRYTLADANDPRDFEFDDRLAAQPVPRSSSGCATLGAEVHDVEEETELRVPRHVRVRRRPESGSTDLVEDVPGAEVLSLGHSLEIVKDLGDAETGRAPVRPRRLPGHARDRSRPHGDRVRRRHLGRAPVLGVSVQRRRGRAQRPAHELLPVEAAPRAHPGTASSPSATPRSSPSTSPRR